MSRRAYGLLLACVLATTAILVAPPLDGRGPGYPVNPDELYNQLAGNANLDQEPGEGWAWHASHSMDRFVRAYLAWGGTVWLDTAVQYFDFVIDHMREGPDGYMGWIGPYIYDNDVWCDVHIADAILINHMLRFALVIKEDPDLHDDYWEHAQRYIDLARVDFFEKWDSRGTWYDDGRYGNYHMWDHYLEPNDFSEWHHDETRSIHNSGLGNPANKNNSMGVAALRLYRLTGDEQYRDKAEKIFRNLKSRFHRYVFDGFDTVTWNYWEPAVPTDINPANNTTRHWVNVHPYRNYQAGEVGEIVEAYHSGIVFDETDIQRIINTNLEVMWNGDMDNPSWNNSNFHTTGYGDDVTAGTRWGALEDFSQTIRDLRGSFGTGRTEVIDKAYHENVTLARDPSFERKYVSDERNVSVYDFPHNWSTPSLNMAFALPSMIVAEAESTVLAVRSVQSGTLSVDVYARDGLVPVHQFSATSIGSRGSRFFEWDGTDSAGDPLPPGEYRIRWTLSDGGHREARFTILPNAHRQAESALAQRFDPFLEWVHTGVGRVGAQHYPWLLHDALGWCFVQGAEGSIWLWQPELGWTWTHAQHAYPILWSSAKESWVYLDYTRPARSEPPGEVSLFNYATGEWEEL